MAKGRNWLSSSATGRISSSLLTKDPLVIAQMIGNSILIPEIHGCYRRHGENNFGTNPVLGSINSVGSMDKHPPHDEFRLAFIRHMLANLDRFLQILGPPGLAALLYRLCSFKELRELIKTQPRIFRGKPGQYLIAYLGYRFKRRLREKRPWSDRLLLIEPPYLTHAPEPGLVERGYWLYNFQKLRERLRS